MPYCVFMHRADSIYDDRPDAQYQFPRPYLGRAETCVGDWIVYLEPAKVRGSRGYFAVARVRQIIEDPKASRMYLALIEPGTYLEFANPVPYNDASGPVERGLLNEEGRLSGRAQAAVRPISALDFDRIIEKGLGDNTTLPRVDPLLDGFSEPQAPYEPEPRNRVQQLSTRAVRDRVFRNVVLRAYDARCALTGLKLINGGGRAEVNAAHIRPVERDGPDTVHSGIALSGTAHWVFDRGLISLGDDFSILISRYANDPDSVRGFLNRSGLAIPPRERRDWPHSRFLSWHRENVFKT
jgi:putative restriction endonuclease